MAHLLQSPPAQKQFDFVDTPKEENVAEKITVATPVDVARCIPPVTASALERKAVLRGRTLNVVSLEMQFHFRRGRAPLRPVRFGIPADDALAADSSLCFYSGTGNVLVGAVSSLASCFVRPNLGGRETRSPES